MLVIREIAGKAYFVQIDSKRKPYEYLNVYFEFELEIRKKIIRNEDLTGFFVHYRGRYTAYSLDAVNMPLTSALIVTELSNGSCMIIGNKSFEKIDNELYIITNDKTEEYIKYNVSALIDEIKKQFNITIPA